jgi:reactive intermediate/imine deaminase
VSEDLGPKHQLHGVQPVLPVADVTASAHFYRDVLGFDIDFLSGDPPGHGRVKKGDFSYGAPIYIHLSKALPEAVRPSVELRIHVGRDVDGLFDVYRTRGAMVVLAPISQPWGLREFAVRDLDGHVLRFCAETSPTLVAPQKIDTARAPRPKAPIAQAVRTGNLVFVSGITPFTLDLELAKGDFQAQMRQTMTNLGAILEAAGSGFDRVVKCTVLLARRDDWPVMNEIYAACFPSGAFPARTAFQALLPHPDFLVEVECVAEVRQSSP